MGMNALAGSISATVMIGARRSARGSLAGAVVSAMSAGILAAWASSILFGLFPYSAGGLLADERLRRVFTLLYSVVFTFQFVVALTGVGVTFLLRRNSKRS
jgi:hypothetical protein